MQALFCFDGAIGLSPTALPVYHLPRAIDATGTGQSPLTATALSDSMRIPVFLSANGLSANGAPSTNAIRVGGEAIPSVKDLRARIGGCLAEPPVTPADGRPPAKRFETAPPPGGAALPPETAVPSGLAKLESLLPGSRDSRANHCALLMGLLLLSAGDPALRYGSGGSRGQP